MGPKNTNTPNSTPTPQSSSGNIPVTPQPSTTLISPSITPTPTSRRNSIPSSAKGDIILHTDKPAPTSGGPKKGIVIAIIAFGVVLILGLIIFAMATSSQQKTNNQDASPTNTVEEATTAVVSISDLRETFNNLAQVLIADGGSQAETPDFSLPLEEWQMVKMNDSVISNTTQKAYADTLLENATLVHQTFQDYVNSHRGIDSEEYLEALTLMDQLLYDKLIASTLYYGADSFLLTIKSQISQDDNALTSLIDEELSIGENISDEVPKLIVENLRLMYEQEIPCLRLLIELGCINKKGVDNPICNNGRDIKSQLIDNQELVSLSDGLYGYADIVNTAFSDNLSHIYNLIQNYLKPTLEALNE